MIDYGSSCLRGLVPLASGSVPALIAATTGYVPGPSDDTTAYLQQHKIPHTLS